MVQTRQSSTSTAKNIYGAKFMLCIWWDQLSVVYYELFHRNHHWETLSATIDAIEPSIEAKITRLREKTRQ